MNENTHEKFSIGNGGFYAVMQGLSIKEVRSEHSLPSPCSIEYLKKDDTLFTKSQRIFNSSRWHTRLLRIINRGTTDEALIYTAEADDRYFPDIDAFVRSFSTKAPLEFRLILGEGVKLLKVASLVSNDQRTESYWIKTRHENYEEILEISLVGECHFNMDTLILHITPGESNIIFSMGTIPMVIQKNTVKILNLLSKSDMKELPPLFKEEGLEKIRNSLFTLTTHLANKRGIVSGSNDCYIRMLPVYTVIRLFNRLGFNKLATAVATNSLRCFLSVKDCVALGRNNDPQYASDIFSLTPSLLMLSALEAPNEAFLKSMISYLSARCRIQSKTLINGMLPFEGREYYYKRAFPITDGSAVSTLFFIKSAEIICQNSEDKELISILENAKASFKDNFTSEERIYLNSPKRSQTMRFPKYIYGQCNFCDNENFTWLTKNSCGAYCCDECLPTHKSKPAPQLGVREESYLPALWSVYLGMNCFTPEEVFYSQEFALKTLDTLPTCDLALLLYSMSKYHHKAKQQVYDLLISKRSSLDIWYTDKGEFDTMTNALCCHAVFEHIGR